MLTNNYKIELMIPSQINKDVAFNESITKLDSFCNIAINSFKPARPEELDLGAIYILSDGPDKNSICYCPSKASGWKSLAPAKNMIFFIISEQKFFIFDGKNWQLI